MANLCSHYLTKLDQLYVKINRINILAGLVSNQTFVNEVARGVLLKYDYGRDVPLRLEK